MAEHLPYPGIFTPGEWGSRVDYQATNWVPWQPDKWVFHWPGSPSGSGWDVAVPPYTAAKSVQALRDWEAFHIDGRGWAGIAYNYAVDLAGNVFMLRGEQRSAATSGDQEPDGIPENHEARAVLFMVNADTGALTDELVAAVQQLWTLDPGPVFGHKQISTTGTACPGTVVSQFINEEGYMPTDHDHHTTHNDASNGWGDVGWQWALDNGVTTVDSARVHEARREDIAAFLRNYHNKVVVPLINAAGGNVDIEAIVDEIQARLEE